MAKQPHVTRLTSDPGYDRDDYETPPELFKKLDDCFRFDLDAAASVSNAYCSEYWSKGGEPDALEGDDWDCVRALSIFCNPPFSKKEEFLKRGIASRNDNYVTVFLLPNNARSTKWWNDYIVHADLLINLTPRVNYCINAIEKKGVAFDSCAVVYYPRIKGIRYGLPKEVYWNWKE